MLLCTAAALLLLVPARPLGGPLPSLDNLPAPDSLSAVVLELAPLRPGEQPPRALPARPSDTSAYAQQYPWARNWVLVGATTAQAQAVQGTYRSRPVPYLAPQALRVAATGGPWHLALYDHGSGGWRLHGGAQRGAATVDVGLSANAADAQGRFQFAILPEAGPVAVSSVALLFPDAPASGRPVRYSTMLPMRDGVALATDVFLPYLQRGILLPDPPFPSVLVRTPYVKENVGADYVSWVSRFNAVVVIQHFRGRPRGSGAWPDSAGTPSLFRDHAGPDHFDAVDTARWIQGRQFHSGELLLIGASALGLWIHQAAPELGDAVSATYTIAAAGDVGRWAAFEHGCFKQSNVEGWITDFGFPPAVLSQARADALKAETWDALDFNRRAGEVRAPGWHETGWWDVDAEETIATWRALNERGGPGARGQQWLVIGPWQHIGIRTGTAGEMGFPYGSVAQNPTLMPLAWEGGLWCAYQLGHNPFYTPPEARVRAYFVGAMGSTTAPSNTWYELPTWPPPGAVQRVFRLSASTSGPQAPDELTYQAAAGADDPPRVTGSALTYRADPADPVPTLGGANLPVGDMQTGPHDQRPVESRGDIAIFTGAPLSHRLSVAGTLTARLRVSTDAADTDVMVKLIDEYPDGRRFLIADTGMRLSWHCAQAGLGRVEPGRAYDLELPIGARAWVFEPGHRLSLVVQGSNYPRFAVNPGTGEAFLSGSGRVQQNTLRLDACSLSLPEYDPERR